MKYTGILKDVFPKMTMGEIQIVINLEQLSAFDDLKPFVDDPATEDHQLMDVTIEKHRDARSIRANNHFHGLVDRLAKARIPTVSFDWMKNYLIHQYGQPLVIDGELKELTTDIQPDYLLNQSHMHVWPISQSADNPDLTVYQIYRGTATYNSKEMYQLISGTHEDAKMYGVPTMTEKELWSLVESWKPQKGKSCF